MVGQLQRQPTTQPIVPPADINKMIYNLNQSASTAELLVARLGDYTYAMKKL